jgi:alkanesulfonate monooxygenase SsuD/methylene tetrahydromethanopterin reductase-like flavin-dependent oxidoreductase (luciferase family)
MRIGFTMPQYGPIANRPAALVRFAAEAERLVAGFGVSWSPDEFEAVGVPFSERGRRLDEILDVLEKAWTQDVVAHDSPLWRVPPSRIDHKPAKRPPIQLGGFTPAVAAHRPGRGRLVGRWHPAGPADGGVPRAAADREPPRRRRPATIRRRSRSCCG